MTLVSLGDNFGLGFFQVLHIRSKCFGSGRRTNKNSNANRQFAPDLSHCTIPVKIASAAKLVQDKCVEAGIVYGDLTKREPALVWGASGGHGGR